MLKTRFGSFRRAFVGMTMAVVLVLGMCPGLASASTLGAGQADDSIQALSTQASAKTVYVVTAMKQTATNGSFAGASYTTKYKYSYNGKGLMAKSTVALPYGDQVTSFSYKGNNLSSASRTAAGTTLKVTYALDGKGRATEATVAAPAGVETGVTASYKGGNLVKRVLSASVTYDGQQGEGAMTYKYAYKNGRVASATDSSGGYSRKISYKYDGNGNLTTTNGAKRTLAYDSKKRIKKETFTANGVKYVQEYTYKAVKVPSAAAAKARAQQWALQNDNLNFALGIAPVY